jgi:Flp pilus assembly protein TadD
MRTDFGVNRLVALWLVLTCAPLAVGQEGAPPKRPQASPVDAIEAAIRKDLKLPPVALPRVVHAPTDSAAEVVTLPALPKGKDRLPALEAAAQQYRTAQKGAALYRLFLADDSTTAEEKAAVKEKMEAWAKAEQEGLIRIGRRWVPPREAETLTKQVTTLVDEASALIAKKDHKGATAQLDKAARIDPDRPEIPFLQGVSAYLADDLPLAERRFGACLQRMPENATVLNNLGVCGILSKKYAAGMKHLLKGATLEPHDEFLSQNLGTFLEDVKSKKVAIVDRKLVEQAQSAYELMLAAKAPPFKPLRGYLLARSLGK